MANNAISLQELNSVVTALTNQRDSINSTYNNIIKKVLESSSSCFSVAGLDYSLVSTVFEDTFKTLNNNFTNLIDVLQNNVIRNYSELTTAIRTMFGPKFAQRLSELIGIGTDVHN